MLDDVEICNAALTIVASFDRGEACLSENRTETIEVVEPLMAVAAEKPSYEPLGQIRLDVLIRVIFRTESIRWRRPLRSERRATVDVVLDHQSQIGGGQTDYALGAEH